MNDIEPGNVEREIARFDSALIAGDSTRLAELVSPAFTMINPLAQQMTRSQWLAWLASDVRYVHIHRESLASRVFKGCAIVTSNVTALMAVRDLYGGAPTEHRTFRTEIWAATSKGLRLEHVHLTRMGVGDVHTQGGNTETEQELRQIEQRRSDAMEHCDREALEALYSEDFVLVHADGSVDDKQGAIESAFRTRRRVVDARKLSIRICGEMALMTGPMTLAVSRDGAEQRVPIYLGQVACHTPGGWRFVWSQVTLMGSG